MSKDLSDKTNSEIDEEFLNKASKDILALSTLSPWMNKHFDELFEKVPEDIKYIVGVVNPENLEQYPKLHGFKVKYTKKPVLGIFGKEKKGALDFMKECYSQDKIPYTIYRHEREFPLIPGFF